jgi:hypothetical protein
MHEVGGGNTAVFLRDESQNAGDDLGVVFDGRLLRAEIRYAGRRRRESVPGGRRAARRGGAQHRRDALFRPPTQAQRKPAGAVIT